MRTPAAPTPSAGAAQGRAGLPLRPANPHLHFGRRRRASPGLGLRMAEPRSAHGSARGCPPRRPACAKPVLFRLCPLASWSPPRYCRQRRCRGAAAVACREFCHLPFFCVLLLITEGEGSERKGQSELHEPTPRFPRPLEADGSGTEGRPGEGSATPRSAGGAVPCRWECFWVHSCTRRETRGLSVRGAAWACGGEHLRDGDRHCGGGVGGASVWVQEVSRRPRAPL